MGATVFFADAASELATVANTFEESGSATDPGTVALTITDPTGTSTSYAYNPGTIIRDDVGAYHQDVPCTVDGIWVYKWVSTGDATDIQEGTWTVGPSQLNQNYCTVEELKSRLGITDGADDFELGLAAAGASRSIDEITGRYFFRATDTRTYVPESVTRLNLDDLVSVTALSVDRDGDGEAEETWTQGVDYALEVTPGRYNVNSKGEPWPYTAAVVITGGKLFPYVWMWSHLDRVQVTGVFGWPSVPLNVKNAALIAAADLFRSKDAPFGVLGVGDLGVIRVGNNPKVQALLRRYINGNRVGV